jgi:feoC like transcriptional regulator
MMLIMQLKNYVKTRRKASLGELSREFNLPESAIEAMMQLWIKKGVITKSVPHFISLKSSCPDKSCSSCQLQEQHRNIVFFRYQDN